ncbi:carboxypeptidase-like regulatory domain-containing protein [Longimicrobium sp.]|uniref:carboxypeptidase-like regulatory domain-containing protein n=1 Tax=Longimicrobium sp. TaxID=2029185 RepID=UPI002E3438A5|nr:carboxypeptidase-like regulatory domain-containing protein [Longimicrobium sp.]HEX6037086.1 carboxypeptidase-like regulatory domain-containing protein [Longimicrobium sp.]
MRILPEHSFRPPGPVATMLAMLVVLVLAACVPGGIGPQAPGGGREAVVSGLVRSIQGGPVAGADVRVAGGGSARTDAEGRFSITGVRPHERAAVWVTSDSFATAATAYPVRAGYETVVYVDLIPAAPPQRLDASRGGRMPVGSGGSLQIEPGSLVDASGRPAQGTVLVRATYIDPADPLHVQAAPGNYMAVDDRGGMRLLRTYGMVDITATDASGARLSLAPGRTATLDWPDAGGAGGALYRLVDTGDWRYESQGPRLVPSLGVWNYDTDRTYVCLQVQVTPAAAGVVVRAHGTGYSTQGTTDKDGRVTLAVEPNATVILRVPGSGLPGKGVQTSGPGQSYDGAMRCPAGASTSATLDIPPASGLGVGRQSHQLSGLYQWSRTQE